MSAYQIDSRRRLSSRNEVPPKSLRNPRLAIMTMPIVSSGYKWNQNDENGERSLDTENWLHCWQFGDAVEADCILWVIKIVWRLGDIQLTWRLASGCALKQVVKMVSNWSCALTCVDPSRNVSLIQSQTNNTDENKEETQKRSAGWELMVVGIGRRSVGLTGYLFSLVKGNKRYRKRKVSK